MFCIPCNLTCILSVVYEQTDVTLAIPFVCFVLVWNVKHWALWYLWCFDVYHSVLSKWYYILCYSNHARRLILSCPENFFVCFLVLSTCSCIISSSLFEYEHRSFIRSVSCPMFFIYFKINYFSPGTQFINSVVSIIVIMIVVAVFYFYILIFSLLSLCFLYNWDCIL